MSSRSSLAESFLVPDLLVLLGRVLLTQEFKVPSDPRVRAKPPDIMAIMRYFHLVSKQLSALLERAVTPSERFFLSSRTVRTSAYLPLAVHNFRSQVLLERKALGPSSEGILARVAKGSPHYPEIDILVKEQEVWVLLAMRLASLLGDLMPRNTVAFASGAPEDHGPWLRYSTPVMPLIIFDKPPPESNYFQRRDFFSILPKFE
jgi:hypothetical protein